MSIKLVIYCSLPTSANQYFCPPCVMIVDSNSTKCALSFKSNISGEVNAYYVHTTSVGATLIFTIAGLCVGSIIPIFSNSKFNCIRIFGGKVGERLYILTKTLSPIVS